MSKQKNVVYLEVDEKGHTIAAPSVVRVFTPQFEPWYTTEESQCVVRGSVIESLTFILIHSHSTLYPFGCATISMPGLIPGTPISLSCTDSSSLSSPIIITTAILRNAESGWWYIPLDTLINKSRLTNLPLPWRVTLYPMPGVRETVM
jgi:hypothetical protein